MQKKRFLKGALKGVLEGYTVSQGPRPLQIIPFYERPIASPLEKYMVLMSKSLKWLKSAKIAKMYEKPKKTSKI